MTAVRDPQYLLIALEARLARLENSAEGLITWGTAHLMRRALQRLAPALGPLVGMDYRGLGFTQEDARAADHERDALLQSMSTALDFSAGGSKLHIGPLSSGCQICENGDWACNFINRLCTRDCDFCKREHTAFTNEPEPETAGVFFSDPVQHVEYLKRFNIKGVGFSGGEPLLVPDRLRSHIHAIRQEFGSEIYIWMYTNGDLVNTSLLRLLRDAGLDEIRFNIAARGYDLAPVILANETIPTVTVEIPALPEAYETVRDLLFELKSIGVDYLNLHQLTLEEENYRNVLKYGIHLVASPRGIAVFESEMCALKLMRDACDAGIDMPINYCSRVYKDRYQSRGLRKQTASAVVRDTEEITEAGYIRSLELIDSPDKINDFVNRVGGAGKNPAKWCEGADGSTMEIHSTLLPFVDWSSAKVTVSYLDPRAVRDKLGKGLDRRHLKLTHQFRIPDRTMDDHTSDCWTSASAGQNDESFLGALQLSSRLTRDRATGHTLKLALRHEILDRGLPRVS